MRRPHTLGKLGLTYGLCGVLTVQPAMANVVVGSASSNTSKTQAGNGVEVINIATPNDKGLSHNKYDQFNVGEQGLILNNATDRLTQTQLGGLIQHNPNLNGKSASVILNEVTKANRSQLNGYTEVAGQQANVVLANPYGITCNGCGFINTPRVTLSTGTPNLQNGELTGFDVEQGGITIDGKGLDATGQTYFDLISRTAQINAAIHANDLSVVTGRNEVGYQTNTVKAKADDNKAKPKVAIDSSSIGGMYAGRISLVATEAGVGVNLGNLVANQSDIIIDANGNLALSNTQSKNSTQITSSERIDLSGIQVAQNAVQVKGASVHFEQAQVAAQNKVSIDADQSITSHQSQIISGLDAQGQTNAGANLVLSANDVSLNASEVVSYGELRSQVSDIRLDEGSELTANTVHLEQLSSLTNEGAISANQAVRIKGDDVGLKGRGQLSAQSIELEAGAANVESNLTGKVIRATVSDTLDITQSATLSAQELLTLEADRITQKGNMTSLGDTTLQASTLSQSGRIDSATLNVDTTSLVNTGTLTASENMALSGREMELSGDIHARERLNIEADNLTLKGEIVSGALNANVLSTTDIDQQASIAVTGKAQLASQTVTHRGQMTAGQSLNVEADTLTNLGEMRSAGDITMTVEALTNRGQIEGQHQVAIAAANNVNNHSQIAAGDALTLDAQTLNNHHTLSSQGNTHVTATNITNSVNGLISGNVTTMSSSQLTNQGSLQALDSMNLTVTSLINKGSLVALNNLNVNSAQSINNQGLLYAGGNGYLYSTTLTNTSDIVVGQDLLIAKNTAKQKSSSVTNSSGTIESLGGNVSIYTGTLTNKRTVLNIGEVASEDNRVYFTPVFIANDTEYEPEHRVTSESVSNSDGYNNRTEYTHYIDSGDTFTALAYISGQKLLEASNAGRIVAQKSVLVEGNNVVNNASQIAGETVTINANSLTNTAYTFSEMATYYDYELRWAGWSHSASWGGLYF